MDTRTQEFSIRTRDGACPARLFSPAEGGPWPAVILYMDALGIRPAIQELARRLAAEGYAVLLPDLFYRSGPYEVMDPAAIFADPGAFQHLKDTHMVHITIDNVMADTRAFIDFLAHAPDVDASRIGTSGYCMGGRLSLSAAGHWPKRIKASASFHGSYLATDAADSAHLLAPRMQARVLVAGATGDKSFPDAMKARLKAALDAAGVSNSVETWPAKHGWVFRDMPVYDAAMSEKHFKALTALFADTLKR